jgi:DNA-nicking Smr family endonuclease
MTRKPFDVPDHGLWDEIKRNVIPLSQRHTSRGSGGALKTRAPAGLSHPIVQVRAVAHGNPPQLTTFDRRLQQKLLRGQIEPEASIDLHGESADSARMRLYHFLQTKRQSGVRLVLVVTGKGSGALTRHTLHGRDWHETPDRNGRLRREVPLWLNEAQFRALAIGFQPAHPRHGGGGALYVRLRKRDYAV